MPTLIESQFPEFLREPREQIDIEIKSWLDLSDNSDRATVAKAIIALANSGGGILVIGFTEQPDGRFIEDAARPQSLDQFSADRIQDIVRRYCDPAIQCSTMFVEHPVSGNTYPVIQVPSEHRSPIRARRGGPNGQTLIAGRTYVRRPGPSSEEPQSTEDWDQLLNRCLLARKGDLLDSMRAILDNRTPNIATPAPDDSEEFQRLIREAQDRWQEKIRTQDQASPVCFPDGFYEVGAVLNGDFPVQQLPQFRDTISQALRNHSGWPPFVIINRPPHLPYPIDGLIEAWIGPEEDGTTEKPEHHDFWRISPEGFFFTRRGFQEDGRHYDMQPGTYFDITTSALRIGETLLQISYVAEAIGAQTAEFRSQFSWSGLAGRELVSRGNPNRIIRDGRVCNQNHYSTDCQGIAGDIANALPELVFNILSPLYQLFDFWQLPRQLVEEELRRLQRQHF